MKKTKEGSRMVSTLKMNIFVPIKVETVTPKVIDGVEEKLNGRVLTERNVTAVTSFLEIDGHIAANNDCCDLRPMKERYNANRRSLAPSCIDAVLSAESMVTEKYVRINGEQKTLYDFISIDVAAGDDNDESVQYVKDLLCYDGLYVPLDKLKSIGYVPHEQTEIVILEGTEYVRYRVALQSASENRLCKATFTTYQWKEFAETISAGANYLYNPTQTAVKAISRQGLAKTGGKIVKNFHFTFALIPDLELDIDFRAKCFYDSKNKIVDEVIREKKNCTDGHGYILPRKAKELANAAACDGIRMALIKGDAKSPCNQEFLLPGHSLQTLASISTDNDVYEVADMNNEIVFVRENMLFTMRKIMGSFIDTSMIIKSIKPIYTAVTDVIKIREVLDLISIGAGGQPVNIVLWNGQIHLNCNGENGSVRSTIAANISNNTPELGFFYNTNMMCKLFQIVDGKIKLEFDSKGILLVKTRSEVYLQLPRSKPVVNDKKNDRAA